MISISSTKLNIQAIFFDVAHTLLYKPDLYHTLSNVLKSHQITIDLRTLAFIHKLYSETVVFPDKTSKEFYEDFNREFLYLLGVIPTQGLLDDIFQACDCLPWDKFADTSILKVIKQPIGILSNWDSSLSEKLISHFDVKFEWILCSQKEGARKPQDMFFQMILETTGFKPSNIIYVGDSIKLDIEPSLKLGMNAILIDRYDCYPGSKIKRIMSLSELNIFL
jgi:FMN phosphatase YigB (HAD superfamily)